MAERVSYTTYQIGSERARHLLDHADRYHIQRLARTEGRDYMKRQQFTASSEYVSRGDRMALSARTEWHSDGVRYHWYINVRAFTCEGNDCSMAREAIEEQPDSGIDFMIPESKPGMPFSPTAFYLGDFNGDRRMDLMVFLENGRAMVFEQLS